RAALALEQRAPARRLAAANDLLLALARLLREARGSGEDAVEADVDVAQHHALVRQRELADLVRVRHAARLQHVEPAVALAVLLEVPEEQPGVHERRDAD